MSYERYVGDDGIVTIPLRTRLAHQLRAGCRAIVAGREGVVHFVDRVEQTVALEDRVKHPWSAVSRVLLSYDRDGWYEPPRPS